MRVTFETIHRHLNQNISDAAERMLKYQVQVGTGKRVVRPSDDPSAASRASVERARLASTDQYSATADSAKSRLLVADTVVSDVVRQLTSAGVVVLAARGSQVTAPQREAWALELENLRDSLLQDLNASFRGTYIFGGATGTTPPYTKDVNGVVSAYQGSTTEVSVDIDQNREVVVVFDGRALARGSEVNDIFVVLDQAIDAARAGDTDGLTAVADDIQRAFDRATLQQSRIGAALRAVDDGKLQLDESARTSEAHIATLEDANIAAAVTGMSQADTVYRAALAAAAQIQRMSLMDYLR